MTCDESTGDQDCDDPYCPVCSEHGSGATVWIGPLVLDDGEGLFGRRSQMCSCEACEAARAEDARCAD